MSSQNNSTPWSLDWADDLSVYIPELDAEHRRFFHLLNELNLGIIGRMNLVEIQQRMQAILDDAAIHFAHEESLFKEWNYLDADEHAAHHKQAVLALSEIVKGFQHGELEYVLIKAALKVKETLIRHILVEDMKYRDFFKAKNLNS